MRKLSVTVLLFFFFQNGYSQSDFREAYVVTNKGDTLTGFIEYNKGSKIYKFCDFKKSKSQDAVTYKPNQLRGYGFLNDKYFESKVTSTDSYLRELHFLEVLVKGKVNLYKYRSKFFVEKNNTVFYQLSNEKKALVFDGKAFSKALNKHVAILTMLLSDCESINDKIKEVGLNEKELTNLVEHYNLCSGEPYMTLKEQKAWLTPTVGFTVGINSSLIKFESINQGYEHLTSKFDRSNSIITGISFGLKIPRLNERFSLTGGAFYLSTEYISYSETNRTYFGVDRNDVSIEIEQLKVPVGFRYTLPDRKITPYLNLGVSSTVELSTNSLWIKESEHSKVIETFEDEALANFKNQFGYWAGLGVKKSVSSKLTISGELRYEQTNGITSDQGLNSQIQNFQFLMYIGF